MEPNEQTTAPETVESAETTNEGQAETFESPEAPVTDESIQEEAPQEGQVEEWWEPATQEEMDYKSEYERVNNSYSELRSKFDKGNQEYKQQIEDAKNELWVYQDYYKDNYQLLEALNNNPEMLEQLKAGIQPEQLSKEDVATMMEQKLQAEFDKQKENADFDLKYNKWQDSNKDVPASVMEKVAKDLEESNIDWYSNDQIIALMDRSLAYHNMWHQKALWAKEEQVRQEKLKKASVWWATNQPESTPQPTNNFFRPQGFNNQLF